MSAGGKRQGSGRKKRTTERMEVRLQKECIAKIKYRSKYNGETPGEFITRLVDASQR